jgi:hypothetical protein
MSILFDYLSYPLLRGAFGVVSKGYYKYLSDERALSW